MTDRQRSRAIPWTRLLAEGAVIVAGVLIALAADRWMQGLDDRRLEREYLAQLLDDFENADSALTWGVRFAERRLAYADLVQQVTEGALPDSVGALELARALHLSSWLVDPPVPRDTWSELVADGRLTLLTNRSLRRDISLFYGTIDQQSEFHGEWTEFVRPFRTAATGLLPPRLGLAIAKWEIEGEPIDPALVPDRASLIAAIRAESDLRRSSEPTLTQNWAAVRQYGVLLEHARRIAEAIRVELGG